MARGGKIRKHLKGDFPRNTGTVSYRNAGVNPVRPPGPQQPVSPLMRPGHYRDPRVRHDLGRGALLRYTRNVDYIGATQTVVVPSAPVASTRPL